MEYFFHGGSDTILLLLIGALGWFMSRKFDGDADKHKEHFAHSSNLNLHETERERLALRTERELVAKEVIRHSDQVAATLLTHSEQDDKRFDRIEVKMDVMSDDIKDILKAVKP